MRIRFIISHPTSYLFSEVREAVIAERLMQLGHDAAVYRYHKRSELKHELFRNHVPVSYFPSDNPGSSPHRMVSSLLLERLEAEKPDLLVFKGLGYDIVPHVLNRMSLGSPRIGFILGGTAVDPVLERADFVLAESQGQIEAIHEALGRFLPCRTLAKYLDWDLADQIYSARHAGVAPDYDIVNVGSFEPRKNQIALRAFFGRYRIALVGGGEGLEAVAQAAAGKADVHLLGGLPNAEALAVVGRARLMVHASLWEGVPRAIFESLACGTPVVAHNFAIQERYEGTSAVRLVGVDELVPTAEALLANPSLLAEMAQEGRAYAKERNGAQHLIDAADHMLKMAGLT
ncbi:glycosyltransferase [Dankookia rubra]|uniref:Glycosyltransferase n=1 Tax=Dankookia rubra TaxID=1442381 RepID=A0A4R5QDH9_9PROT|nr:glycosyltransferase [Dankookia rubra]TDH60863.1 glycosyltransferase [Dankookia rubra]